MKNGHSKTLPTICARTIVSIVKNDKTVIDSAEIILKKAHEIMEELKKQFPNLFNEDCYLSAYACTLSMIARKGVKQGTLTIPEFMSYYAQHKVKIGREMQDFGVFGDLLELLVRLAFVPRSLRKASMLAVKSTDKTDLISKRLGETEIGHNGKSWTQATLFDYMEGKFDAVIYGMFAEEDKNDIFNLCINGQYEKAIDYIAEYMCVWPNKYDYLHDMDNLSSGRGIALKGENVQTVFNPSKYKAFQNAIENGQFTTLVEYLKK